jgi:hypothetical protein
VLVHRLKLFWIQKLHYNDCKAVIKLDPEVKMNALMESMIAEAGKINSDKAEKLKALAEYLREKGAEFEIDDDGDIITAICDFRCFLIIDNSDPHFFRLLVPGFFELNDENKEMADEVSGIVEKITRETKVIKMFMYENRVSVVAEIFYDSIPGLQNIFPRLVGAVKFSITNFIAQYQEAEYSGSLKLNEGFYFFEPEENHVN